MIKAGFKLGLPDLAAHVFPHAFGHDSAPTHAHRGAGPQTLCLPCSSNSATVEFGVQIGKAKWALH